MEPSGDRPHPVDETEHLWIAMPDGVRLAARLWLPHAAQTRPVPALFEYIPYRKGDMTRARDERNHPAFAAQGYACLRVDMRGSGDSEGQMSDMYGEPELADARHVIAWIAAQSWCDGAVGMFGTSWGGTAGLQAAIDGPPALKAVIAVCATHDRYEDDIHHKGGLLLTDSIEWGATLPAILASPPTFATVGPRWRAMWQERLERLTFPLEAWVREEERSPYWRRGSVTRQADRIGCPVLAIGGWSDRYSNSVMSLVERRPDRVWGIVGPWGHHYPDVGHPGPAIGFQQEALGWWDHWLRGRGAAEPPWPRLRLWLRGFDPPREIIDRRNGGWIELADRAAAVTEPLSLSLGSSGLGKAPTADTAEAVIPHDLQVGSAAGDTGYFGRFGGQPTDQRADDARSLVFDTAPLEEATVLLGAAEVALEIASDQPLAQIALRIGDVAPDGSVSRVALALRNLVLDDTLESGRPLVPGEARRLRLRFHTKAYRFAPGHRIRLALSGSYWPLAWPAPRPARLTLRLGRARLTLPVLAGAPSALSRPFAPPLGQPERFDRVREGRLSRSRIVEADGTIVTAWHQPLTSLRFHETGTVFGSETSARHAIHPDDPLSATSRFDHRMRFERPDGVAEVTGRAEVRATATTYRLSGGVTASWDGAPVFERSWSPIVTRRLA